MSDQNYLKLIKRALDAQIEMGQEELIINRKNIKVIETVTPETLSQIKQAVPITVEQALVSTPAIAKPQFESLDSHFKKICDCQKCSLGSTRNKFVYGVGNPNADIMFVGEAPGANEDQQGEPFVGRAGQLLDKIMAAIQLSRETAYIANILKCRPPANRDPQPDEMEMCFPYLAEQIRLIQPKIICALGRIAAQAILRTNTPLGKLRGHWHLVENVPTIVTYHPAALLRFPSYKRDTWEDMKLLKAKYESMI